MNPITHFPDIEDEVIITCPRCNSSKVLVRLNSNNFYEVKLCHECGYSSIEA